eukprot:881579_1
MMDQSPFTMFDKILTNQLSNLSMGQIRLAAPLFNLVSWHVTCLLTLPKHSYSAFGGRVGSEVGARKQIRPEANFDLHRRPRETVVHEERICVERYHVPEESGESSAHAEFSNRSYYQPPSTWSLL